MTRVSHRGVALVFAFAFACVLAAGLAARPATAQDLDAADAGWTVLLKKHVVWVDGGDASQVDYAGFAADHAALDRYTVALSAVSKPAFDRMPKPRQMAFLINAYNAFTIQLILTRYPELQSIRDLGGLFSTPWKRSFIDLFGQQVSLDGIEHGMLRTPGRYDDPRIHFAVVCASIGCPALRDEAYAGDRLDAQLDDQARRFLSDRTRNRFDPKDRTLRVSKLFDWYGDDFTKNHHGITSVRAFLGAYADQLADEPRDRTLIREQRAPVDYTDYDWRLNDVRHDVKRDAGH